MKLPVLRRRIPLVMAGVGLVFLILYVFAYDKSYYHIDTVREPMIRFLFFESMLLGAYFRRHDKEYRNKRALPWVLASAVIFVAYFASKLLFSSKSQIASIQIVNQLLIFALLYVVFRAAAALDGRLEKLPQWIKNIIDYIAQITLEIYLVQYVLIDVLRNAGPFPINWFVITVSILAAATVLHYFCKLIYYLCDKLILKISDAIKAKKQTEKTE
jgi:peptidoglycan/LPS O-acetylase OafA/YrhL